MKSKSIFVYTRSIESAPSSSKRQLRIGLLSAATITALCANATNASAATLTYFTDLASFNAASSTSLVDDFESGTPKDTTFYGIYRNGNSFASGPYGIIIASPGNTHFGVQPITTTSILTANGSLNQDFSIGFGTHPSAVGFDTYTNIYGAPTVAIIGGRGLLETYSVNQDSTKIGFFGVISSEPIFEIVWTGVNNGAVNTGIDNLRTGFAAANPTSVPEPHHYRYPHRWYCSNADEKEAKI
jgi:hypothetical protein